MKVEVEINSVQIYDNQKGEEHNKCIGEIEYYNNGAVLEFTEKNESTSLNFKITILENKVIVKRNNQDMIFDLQNKYKSTLATPYGNIEMLVNTKKMEIIKESSKIKEINLEYELELENGIKYYNIVTIKITYNINF